MTETSRMKQKIRKIVRKKVDLLGLRIDDCGKVKSTPIL